MWNGKVFVFFEWSRILDVIIDGRLYGYRVGCIFTGCWK